MKQGEGMKHYTDATILSGQKFVASFSGGKDSMFSIYQCLQAGLLPLEMITTFPVQSQQSWFHKIHVETLNAIAEAIHIPLRVIETAEGNYTNCFEQALLSAKSRGANVAVFGDIDIEEHLNWCVERCEAVGLLACFPLWQMPREKVVRAFIEQGFKAQIVTVNDVRLAQGFVGQWLTHDLIDQLLMMGVDVCGENGEYHTVVLDGPLFSQPVLGHFENISL